MIHVEDSFNPEIYPPLVDSSGDGGFIRGWWIHPGMVDFSGDSLAPGPCA